MTEKFTTEGQETPSKESVLELEEGNSKGGNLEPKNGENALQNLENAEAIVASDDGLEEPTEAGKDLLKALFASEGQANAALAEAQTDMETAMAVGTGSVKDLQPSLASLEKAYGEAMGFQDSPDQMVVVLNKGDKENNLLISKAILDATSVTGPQPDGSEKFIVTVQEGYTDAVRQWAESDGVSVERWLSDRLYEYISTYGEPAKGR